MHLDRMQIAPDFALDVRPITRIWLQQLLNDPQFQHDLPRWSHFYEQLLLLLEQYLHDPQSVTGEALGELLTPWRHETGFRMCLHYLQVALTNYLEQPAGVCQKVSSFFQHLHAFPEAIAPGQLLLHQLPEKLERLITASLEAPADSLPDLIVAEATNDTGWQGCTLYWWDPQQFLYTPLATSGKRLLLTPEMTDQLRQRPEACLEVFNEWIRLIIPLTGGRGALAFARPQAPPTPDELVLLHLFALQAGCLLKDLELRQRTTEERMALNRRLIALNSHHSELVLLHDLSRTTRDQTNDLVPRLLSQLMTVLVAEEGALWTMRGGRLQCHCYQGGHKLRQLPPLPTEPARPWQACLANRPDDLPPGLTGLYLPEGPLMAAPLIFANELTGLLLLSRTPPMAPFTTADLRLADTVANFLAPLLSTLAARAAHP